MKKLRFVLCSLLAFLLIATSIPVVTEAAAKPVCQKATTLLTSITQVVQLPWKVCILEIYHNPQRRLHLNL